MKEKKVRDRGLTEFLEFCNDLAEAGEQMDSLPEFCWQVFKCKDPQRGRRSALWANRANRPQPAADLGFRNLINLT